MTRSQILIISVIFPLIIVSICICANKDFFNIDDAVNEYLPFYTQMGRIWASGHFPFLTDSMFMGGNAVVELSHAAFTPQALLASLLAWFCKYKQITAIFLALINTSLICASCLVIGNLYRLHKRYSILFSAFCVIEPVYLFIYSSSWLNAAMGHAWFMSAVATFLLLARQITVRNFLFNLFSVTSLLTTCWTYAVFAYAIFAVLFLIFQFKKSMLSSSLAILLLANILALLAAIPIYSEYIYNTDLHTRFLSLNNRGNFLVFPWSSEILSFWPTYFDFVNWFGGYKFCALPLAFSTIFLPLIFFNRKLLPMLKTNREVKFIVSMIMAYFVCTQLPSTLFSMRWSFRFLPFFAFSLCLATSYILNFADEKRTSFLYFLIFISICSLLSISKSLNGKMVFPIIQSISVILLLAVYFTDKINFKNLLIYPFFSVVVLLVLLCDTKFAKDRYLPIPTLHNTITFPSDFNQEGYIFTLGKHLFNNSLKSYTSLYFNRAGFVNVKSINGYTPLGYKNWGKFLPGHRDQPDAQSALDAMLVPVEGADMCRANAWRISTFVLPADVAQKNLSRLEECGYHIGADAADAQPMTYATLPFDMTKGWEKLPPVAIPPLEGVAHESHRDALDILFLPAREAPRRLVFPRLFWHGYRASLNGRELEITPDESGFLTSVTVPAGEGGRLEFSFFPETWRYLWVCPLFSLIGALLCCLYVRRRRPGGIWASPPRPRP